MSFDVRSLYFAGAILSVLQVLGLLPLGALNRKIPGMKHWMASTYLYSVGLSLYVLQVTYPQRELTFLLPTLLCVAAGIAFYAGACRFTGAKAHLKWMFGINALMFGVYLYFLYGPGTPEQTLQGRVQSTAAAAGFIYVLTAIALWKEKRSGLKFVAKIAGAGFGFYALSMVWRVLNWWLRPPAAWNSGNSIDNVMMSIFVIVASYLWMFWIILLIHQYQRMELSKSLAAQYLAEEELLKAKNEIEKQRSLHLRQVMARDLHDGIGGITATLAMLASLGREEVGEEREKLLRHIETIAVEGNQEVRVLMSSLETGVVRWDDWLVDLRNYTGRATEAAGLRLEWEVRGKLPDEAMSDTAAAISLMRAVKEAVHNLTRHAEASLAWLVFRFHAGRVVIAIGDDGRGFRKERKGGRGMKNMAQRVQELGGTCKVQGGDGTIVEFSVPLPLEYAHLALGRVQG